MAKTKLCENCNKHPVRIKDYRGIICIGSLLSCLYCFNLTNEDHNRVKTSMENPKKYLSKMAIEHINERIAQRNKTLSVN